MRILFALPGLHRHDRGAEIAFMSIANELASLGEDVTLMGAGDAREGCRYKFTKVPALRRESFERFPKIPALRNETAYEEASFLPSLALHYRPADYDVTVTCAYPFTNWFFRRPVLAGRRPRHIFVTQNGDWPAFAQNSEYHLFGCDGLVCINPDYYDRNKERWRSALIPNGMDPTRFSPGSAERAAFGLPEHGKIVLMVSAMIASKRVDAGIRAVAQVPGAHLVVAGDGPMRDEIKGLANEMLPDRFTQLSVKPDRMAALYRSADVFLHLSQDESFGNVYVEAMACGLPIVAHDSARTRWIVGDEEYLAPSDDAEVVSHRLGQAFVDTPSRQSIRLNRATQFHWSSIAGQYREFFTQVIRT